MMPVYGNWRELRRYRPWIAVVRHRLRRATWKDWLIVMGLTLLWPLVDFLSNDRGTLFASDAPQWVLKLWQGAFWGIFLSGSLASSRRIERIFDTRTPSFEDPWVPVDVNLKNGVVSGFEDRGAVCIEEGKLMFSGERTSFQLRLDELEIVKKDDWIRQVTLLVKPTRQKLTLGFYDELTIANWKLLVEHMKAGTMPGYSPSIFPPKPYNRAIMEGFAAIFLFVIASEPIGAIAWELSKALPLHRDLRFLTTFLALTFVFISILLWLNLRLWVSVRRRSRLVEA